MDFVTIWKLEDFGTSRKLPHKNVIVKRVLVTAYGSFSQPVVRLKSKGITLDLEEVWKIKNVGLVEINGFGRNVYQFICDLETAHHTELEATIKANGLTILSGSIWIQNVN